MFQQFWKIMQNYGELSMMHKTAGTDQLSGYLLLIKKSTIIVFIYTVYDDLTKVGKGTVHAALLPRILQMSSM